MASSLTRWLGGLGISAALITAISSGSPSATNKLPAASSAVPAVTQTAPAQVMPSTPVTNTVLPIPVKTPSVPTTQPEQIPAPKPTPKPTTTAPSGTYTNTAGNEVPSPYYAPTAPAGASARCRDGTYSFSQSRRGTCSHHGGVAEWL